MVKFASTPVFLLTGTPVDVARFIGRDLEFEAAMGTRENLPFDQVALLDRPTALGTIGHQGPSFRSASTSSMHSACFEMEYRWRPTASWARASWIRTASREGPPEVFRAASDARTSRTFCTSSPNRGSNPRRAFASKGRSNAR